ncbi:MAG: peptidase S41, partial [Bacteroidales bacterium]|nr:peptidase S41 [Bacteroidales bacterium]
ALSKGKFLDGNLVILVNEASASASEIVAGAVQDHDRGVIVGRTTFGKGLVQEQMQLDDSSAVRITVARYHTPSGRCIQRSYANGKEKYYEEYYERYLSGELEFADSIHTVDTTKQYFTDNGRIVYGGGGITPDVFVPIEDLKDNDFYYQIINKSVIFKYAFNYTDSNRDMLMNQFPTAKDFINRFTVTPKMMNDILEEAEKNNITINTTEYQEVKKEIAILTKSYIGRNLFDYEGFYPVYNSMDKEVKKAVEVIHNGNY